MGPTWDCCNGAVAIRDVHRFPLKSLKSLNTTRVSEGSQEKLPGRPGSGLFLRLDDSPYTVGDLQNHYSTDCTKLFPGSDGEE